MVSCLFAAGTFFSMAPGGVAATGDVTINATNFPDPNFMEFVAQYDNNPRDGVLSSSELGAVTVMNCIKMENGWSIGLRIGNFKGIEYFYNLEEFTCTSQFRDWSDYLTALFSLDVSQNKKLRILRCSDNHNLGSLNVSGNPALTILDCSGCDISSLSVNPGIVTLSCSSNNLTDLDLRNASSLAELTCSDNSLTSLDVSSNPGLTYLNCSNNDLGTLDLSNNPSITQLKCKSCGLTELNISNLTGLIKLEVSGNDLSSLDISYSTLLADAVTSSDPLLENNSYYYFGEQNSYLICDPFTQLITTNNGGGSSSGGNNSGSSGGGNSSGSSSSGTGNNGGSSSGGSSSGSGSTSGGSSSGSSSSGSSSSGSGNNGGSSAVTPTPAIPTAAPSSQTSSEPGVAGFVERLYSVALGRSSDPAGKQNWIDAITMRGETGASAARGFLYSPEFLNKQCTNEEFVAVLYRTFFDREPDRAGFNAWVGVLNNGTSKEEVIEGFINSTEWANLCLRYGIRGGGSGTPNIEVEPNQATIDFATRLYTTCLSRNADQNGLMAWARQLANQRDTGTGAARGFFFSNEFTGQNVSNEEFVNRLYRTFMGREADEAGFSAWVGQLNEGVSRETVFNGFAESPEFARICASYGIIR
ncbi:MAG: DUF4214 domain-containing protein [Clostridiales bacterium]|nr:DUF4214 domain-containing protein [Clostridiales bacterium]